MRIFLVLCKHVGFESHTANLKHHLKINMHFKPQLLTAWGGGERSRLLQGVQQTLFVPWVIDDKGSEEQAVWVGFRTQWGCVSNGVSLLRDEVPGASTT